MADGSAFIAAIRAAPDDDAPRLVFADWLDEQDQAGLALYVRRSIRVPEPRGEVHRVRAGSRVGLLHGSMWVYLPCPEPFAAVAYRRGLIEEVELDIYDWLAGADAILAEYPVREVRLTTPFRIDSDGLTVWIIGDPQRQRFDVGEINRAMQEHGDAYKAVAEARWPGVTFYTPRSAGQSPSP